MTLLSPQERRVLMAVGEGWSNTEIARDLEMTAHTVHTHLANAYRKLGAGNRTEALMRGMKSGALDFERDPGVAAQLYALREELAATLGRVDAALDSMVTPGPTNHVVTVLPSTPASSLRSA